MDKYSFSQVAMIVWFALFGIIVFHSVPYGEPILGVVAIVIAVALLIRK